MDKRTVLLFALSVVSLAGMIVSVVTRSPVVIVVTALGWCGYVAGLVAWARRSE